MAQQIVNIGVVANDGTGDSLRVGGDKINDNFTELYALVSALSENPYRGDWAGTTDLPDTGDGGTYTAGAPGEGNKWRLTGTLVIGGNVYPPGTIIEAAMDAPGQTIANWNFYQVQI
jgi:hypothetical protein